MPLVQSFKVQATLSAYRIVSAVSSTANTVGYLPTTTAQVVPLGVTIDTVKDTNQAIPVQMDGIAKVYMNEAVVSGKLVASDSEGRGIAFTPASTSTGLTLPTGVIGTLVGPTVGGTGTLADVAIHPQLIR